MYASMVLMCILLSILFLGGYLAPDFINLINDLLNILDRFLKFMSELNESVTDLIDFYESRLYGLSIFFDLISIFISDSLLICSCVLEFILA
jgi:predicted PurR-regulated permease PerM